MKYTDFIGTGVAIVTPFDVHGQVDYDSLGNIIDHIINGGVEYIVSLGTTGESATLDKEEKSKVIRYTVEHVNQRVPVVAGYGGNNTVAVMQDIETANLEGISAILSVSPYYNKPSQEGIYQHYMRIADSSPVPVIIYNVPGRTACNITAETTLRLAEDHPNFLAIKEASGDMNQCMEIVRNNPREDFLCISGDDAFTLPMISYGFSGVISVIANPMPQEFSNMVRSALAGNLEEANNLHYDLLPIIDMLFKEGSPAGPKSLMKYMGLCTDTLRLPLTNVSSELDKAFEQLAQSITTEVK